MINFMSRDYRSRPQAGESQCENERDRGHGTQHRISQRPPKTARQVGAARGRRQPVPAPPCRRRGHHPAGSGELGSGHLRFLMAHFYEELQNQQTSRAFPSKIVDGGQTSDWKRHSNTQHLLSIEKMESVSTHE